MAKYGLSSVYVVSVAVMVFLTFLLFAEWETNVVAAPPLSLDGLLGDDERLSDGPSKSKELKADNFKIGRAHV